MSFKKLLLLSVSTFKITVIFSFAKAAVVWYEVRVSLPLSIEQSKFLVFYRLLC